MLVSTRNLRFGYDANNLITDLNISITNRETLAIVGGSGSGKSTLLRVLASIEVEGLDVCGKTETNYKKLSFIFQTPILMPFLSVEENISLPLITPDIEGEKVANLIERVGLTNFKDYLPHQLSGGMQARVAIAQSFVTNPDLILMDEPFSSLDTAWRHELYQLVGRLQKQNGAGLAIITHDLDEAVALADTVLVLRTDSSAHETYHVENYPNKEELRVKIRDIIIENHA